MNTSNDVSTNPSFENATWIFRIGEERQHIWLAELNGWKIIRKDEDKATGNVTIMAIRVLRQSINKK